jgi:hypothetical protein
MLGGRRLRRNDRAAFCSIDHHPHLKAPTACVTAGAPLIRQSPGAPINADTRRRSDTRGAANGCTANRFHHPLTRASWERALAGASAKRPVPSWGLKGAIDVARTFLIPTADAAFSRRGGRNGDCFRSSDSSSSQLARISRQRWPSILHPAGRMILNWLRPCRPKD